MLKLHHNHGFLLINQPYPRLEPGKKHFALTGRPQQLRIDEIGQVRFLAVPEDPQLLGGGEREGRMDDRSARHRTGDAHLEHVRVLFGRFGGGNAAPHTQDVHLETFGVGTKHRIFQRVAGRIRPFTLGQFTPFYAAQIGL